MKKNKPIAILVNDVHLNKDNGELVKNTLFQVTDYAIRNKISCIIFGGDIFTNRSGQPLSCLLNFKEILEEYMFPFSQIHIIPGNHDKTDPDCDESYLDVFQNYQNIWLHRGAEMSNLIEGCEFVFIPYYSDEKWIAEYKRISEYKLGGKHNFLITHIGINGVRNNDGTEVDGSIRNDLFVDYDAVFVGHYHDRSKVGKNVYYTGSLYQGNYGEDIDKGFTVIYDDGTFEYVNCKFPHYIKEKINASDRETLHNLIEKYSGEEYDHIRFEIVGSRVECEKISSKDLELLGIDCKFKTLEQTEAVNISEEENVSCYNKKTIMRDFLDFCKENDINGKKMQYGLKLIKQIDYVES